MLVDIGVVCQPVMEERSVWGVQWSVTVRMTLTATGSRVSVLAGSVHMDGLAVVARQVRPLESAAEMNSADSVD